MAVQIPAQAIADAKAADNELWPVLLAIAGPESTWRPDAKGDYKLYWGGPIVDRNTPGAFPTSFGYLQMHQDGGLGSGIPESVLLDGAANMRLGAEYIGQRLSKGTSLWDALSPWSTRATAWALYQRIQAEGIDSDGSVIVPTTGTISLPGVPAGIPAAGLLAAGAVITLLLILSD